MSRIGLTLMAAVSGAVSTLVLTGLLVAMLIHVQNFGGSNVSGSDIAAAIIELSMAMLLCYWLFRYALHNARESNTFPGSIGKVIVKGWFRGLLAGVPGAMLGTITAGVKLRLGHGADFPLDSSELLYWIGIVASCGAGIGFAYSGSAKS